MSIPECSGTELRSDVAGNAWRQAPNALPRIQDCPLMLATIVPEDDHASGSERAEQTGHRNGARIHRWTGLADGGAGAAGLGPADRGPLAVRGRPVVAGTRNVDLRRLDLHVLY